MEKNEWESRSELLQKWRYRGQDVASQLTPRLMPFPNGCFPHDWFGIYQTFTRQADPIWWNGFVGSGYGVRLVEQVGGLSDGP